VAEAYLVAFRIRFVRERERVAFDDVCRFVGVEVDHEYCSTTSRTVQPRSKHAVVTLRSRELTEFVQIPLFDRLSSPELLPSQTEDARA
jgi:hypothetical protein